MTSVGMLNANACMASTVVPRSRPSMCARTIRRSASSIASTARGVNSRFSIPRTKSWRGGSIDTIEYFSPPRSGFSGAGP